MQQHLPKITIGILIAWVIAQIVVLCVYWDSPQFTDALRYQNRALPCYQNGTWYPDKSQLYVDYICYPGYINYLIAHLRIFGSFAFVGIFNILLNLLITLEIFVLTKHFFTKTTACIAVILFCLLPSNTLMCQVHLTEIPFLAAILGALCLLRKDKYFALVAAGTLFFLANWMRPFTILFLLPALVYMYWNRFRIKNYVAVLLPMAALVVLVGCYAKKETGHFIVQASTGGYNIMQGANDKINGGYEFSWYKNSGYIENIDQVTYAERNLIWKERAVEWILEHPVKYIAYIPVKIARMWWGDDYLDGYLRGETPFYSVGVTPTFKQIMQRILSGTLFNLTYYLIMICFILSLFRFRKQMTLTLYLLLVPLVLATLMSGLIVGLQRYHHSYMPTVILFAAWWIDTKLQQRNKHLVA